MTTLVISLLFIGYYLLVLGIVFGVILDNRNPAKTFAYLLVLLFLPVIGLVVYYMFGQNLRKQKLFSRKGLIDNIYVKEWQEKQMLALKDVVQEARPLLREKIKIVNLLVASEASMVTLRNETSILFDGEHIFPRLFDDIRRAKHHVHIEFYILEDDNLGNAFKQILIEKAQEGIEVRLCYDDVGSRSLPKKFVDQLRSAGVEVYAFMPVFWPYLTSKVNFRNHRKIVVIDGEIGYFGGVNIADRYANAQAHLPYWRDTHLRIYGEAVKYVQMQFMLNWKFVSGMVLPIDETYYPEVAPKEQHMMQVVASGPDSDWPAIMQAILMAINTAESYIYITTPYFIPNEEILTALQTAALGGVDVQLLIPAKGDSVVVQAATMSYVKQLLAAGVQVFMYTKGFLHAKTMVVDDLIASVGTTNMDNRSFELNFEINAFCYDKELSLVLRHQFEKDRTTSSKISLARWERRRFIKRITESLARMFAPLL